MTSISCEAPFVFWSLNTIFYSLDPFILLMFYMGALVKYGKYFMWYFMSSLCDMWYLMKCPNVRFLRMKDRVVFKQSPEYQKKNSYHQLVNKLVLQIQKRYQVTGPPTIVSFSCHGSFFSPLLIKGHGAVLTSIAPSISRWLMESHIHSFFLQMFVELFFSELAPNY